MNKELAIQLKKKAQDVADIYSRNDRSLNWKGESFSVYNITPLSDMTAAVILQKHPSEKLAAVFFYYVKGYRDWIYFFPTDSHLIGMECFGQIKRELERSNFSKNFVEVKKDGDKI